MFSTQSDTHHVTGTPGQPKVSIIINNYNYAAFLECAISSALNQTYGNTEVIVVDDGSTDGSRDVLTRYDNRAQVLLKDNGGQVSALNLGFRMSSGDLVIFLDSDDALSPDAIEAAVAYWKSGYVKVHFPLQVMDANNEPTGLLMPRVRLAEGNLLTQSLTTGRYITAPTSGNVFSRVFLEQIFPIPEGTWENGDAYMNTCAPFYGSIGAIRRPLGFYRIHGKSMSAITGGEVVNTEQMHKLIGHAMRERALLEHLADSRGLTLSTNAVVSHWLHLKLRISYYRLTDLCRSRRVLTSGVEMIRSLAKAEELTSFRKLQNMVWTCGVVILPLTPAKRLIAYAFDFAPRSMVGRFLRRA